MATWIEQFDRLSWLSGSDAICTYQRYGAMFGFALAVVAMIGTPILASAVRQEAGVGSIQATGVALIGPHGVVVGTVVNGRIPGRLATPIIIAPTISGITGLREIIIDQAHMLAMPAG